MMLFIILDIPCACKVNGNLEGCFLLLEGIASLKKEPDIFNSMGHYYMMRKLFKSDCQ